MESLNDYWYRMQAEQRELEKQRQRKIKVVENRIVKQIEKQVEKRGIERYFTPDFNNPIDVRILQRLTALGKGDIIQQERFCRVVLAKQLSIDTNVRAQNTDHRIEQALLQCCQKNGIERNDYVRELFCTHFRIRPVAPK